MSIEHTSTTLVIHTYKTGNNGITWYATVTADCCSKSWVESVEAVEYGGAIVEVQRPQFGAPLLTSETSVRDGDVLKIYELRFKTTKGDVVVDFRNSSNGYYGAEIELTAVVHKSYSDMLPDKGTFNV